MAFDAQWHHRFHACIDVVLSKGVIALVIQSDVFIETLKHSYKLTPDEAWEFIEALEGLFMVTGHSKGECALYLAYDYIGAVVPDNTQE